MNKPPPYRRFLFLGSAFAAAGAIAAFWLVLFYPGTMSPDSLSQWGQALSWKMEDWHPIGMTLVMGFVHAVLGGLTVQGQVAAVAWLQGTVFWFSIFALIGMADLSLRNTLIACIGATLYYPIWLYTITLWKDVWFTLTFLWMIRHLYRAALGKQSVWRASWLLVPLLTFAIMNRHTSVLTFLFMMFAIASVVLARFDKRRLMAIWLSLLIVLLAAWGSQKLLYRVLAVEYSGSMSNWIALYEIAGTAQFAGMSASELSQLQSARVLGVSRFLETVRLYRCGIPVDYIALQPGHPLEKADVLDQRSAIADLPTVVLRHPMAYLMNRWCLVSRLIGSAGPVYYPFHEEVSPNEFGIEAHSLWPRARAVVLRWEHRSMEYPVLSWPFRHYLLLIASGLVSLRAFLRPGCANRHLIYFLFTGGLAVLFPLCMVTPAPDWRYLMPADLCWVLSLLIAIAGRPTPIDEDSGI